MNQYSVQELTDFRQRLLGKLEETMSRYQEVLKKMNDLQINAFPASYLDKGSEKMYGEKEKLSSKAGRLRKYLQCITNALIRIDNGTYFLRRMSSSMEKKS